MILLTETPRLSASTADVQTLPSAFSHWSSVNLIPILSAKTRRFLCMVAASTQAWFEESLSGNDVSGGFLNRWLIFTGAPGPLLSFPPEIDRGGWDNFVLDVCGAIEKASGFYDFSKEARYVYDRFYKWVRNEHTSEATARTDLHAKKLGLLYAILAGHDQVEREDIESGMAVADYCAKVAGPLAARLDVSHQKRIEDRLLNLLREGPIGTRELYRKLHVSAGELGRAADSLRQLDEITFEGGLYRLK